jgi:hypothetical protein
MLWYKITNDSITQIEIKKYDVKALQAALGGYIEGVRVHGNTEAYCDEEKSLKNLSTNELAEDIFGV